MDTTAILLDHLRATLAAISGEIDANNVAIEAEPIDLAPDAPRVTLASGDVMSVREAELRGRDRILRELTADLEHGRDALLSPAAAWRALGRVHPGYETHGLPSLGDT